MNSIEISNIFKVLSDKNRIEILYLLKDGEMCACELLENLEISQSTLSHHMKILLIEELVKERKSKKWSFYTINASRIDFAKSILDGIVNENNLKISTRDCE